MHQSTRETREGIMRTIATVTAAATNGDGLVTSINTVYDAMPVEGCHDFMAGLFDLASAGHLRLDTKNQLIHCSTQDLERACQGK